MSYSILSGPATVTGNPLRITGGGAVVVRALQSGNPDYSAAPNVDQSFTVYLTLETSVAGFGTLTCDPDLPHYTNGSVVLLSAVATPGFESIFDGWSGSTSGITNPLRIVMDTNQSITANFVSTNTSGIADVQLVSLDFDPRTVDLSSGGGEVTMTVHLTSGGAPLSRAIVSFAGAIEFVGVRFDLGPQNLVSGDLYDGVFQVTSWFDDWTRVGTYQLSTTYVFDQSGRNKLYSWKWPMLAFPPGTPTNLVVTATNHPTRLGMGWPGSIRLVVL